MSFSSLDLYYLTRELQFLVGTRIAEVYHPNKETILLELYSNKTGKKFLKFNLANSLELVEEKQSSEKPTSFCMYLRKHLSNSKIKSIEQRGFDRIIELKVQIKEETYIIIAEFFPKGNLCLTKDNYEILQCLENQEWNDRIHKPKETYKSPQGQVNPLELKEKEVENIIKNSDKQNIVKTLAISLSLGGEYAETVLSLANIDKKAKTITEKEIKQVYKVLQEIKEDKPTKIEKTKDIAIKISEEEIRKQKEIESLKSILQIQNKKVDESKEEELRERKKGDMLYEFYEESENAIKSKKTEIVLNKIKIILDPKKSLSENAAIYYELAKKSKNKIEGALDALMQTQKKIKEIENNLVQIKDKQVKEIKKPKRKQEWYEKYHWFYSSDGFLCIGGKDSVSNEVIVKKYSEKQELVFHTEAPGSPFFVIKNPNNLSIPKTTLEEVAIATASYSQTWKTDLSTTEVLYVKAEQLTKREGVQKGMFIIEGKKTTLKPVMKLAIANLNDQIIAGPISAIKSKTNNYLTVIQGDLTKNELAKKIKSKIGGELEEIERMLPNGKSKLEK